MFISLNTFNVIFLWKSLKWLLQTNTTQKHETVRDFEKGYDFTHLQTQNAKHDPNCLTDDKLLRGCELPAKSRGARAAESGWFGFKFVAMFCFFSLSESEQFCKKGLVLKIFLIVVNLYTNLHFRKKLD